MKNRIAFLLVALCCLSSCSDICYQVYTVTGASPNFNQDKMTYEDPNCVITYDMWAAGGDAGFIVKNKTQQTLYFDMTKSFFVLNGEAYDFFQNRIYSKSSLQTYSNVNSGAIVSRSLGGGVIGMSGSTTNVASSTSSVGYAERPVIAIPAGTWRFIKGFQICNDLYNTCDYKLKDANDNSSALSFGKSESPIVFSNILAYKVGENGAETTLTNLFYVSSILNVPLSKERKYESKKVCEDDLYARSYSVLVDESANRFYNTYNRNVGYDNPYIKRIER
jgi:hypothetical protein